MTTEDRVYWLFGCDVSNIDREPTRRGIGMGILWALNGLHKVEFDHAKFRERVLDGSFEPVEVW